MNNKIVIAKAGYDATTETDLDHLIFSSDYNTLKYAISGNWEMTAVTGDTVKTIAHNLGYTPFFIVYCNDWVAQPTYYGIVQYYFGLGGRTQRAKAYVDSTNLYLKLDLTAGAAVTVKWYYKIFKNNLGL